MEKLCLLVAASMLWIVPSPVAALSVPQAKGGILADGIIRQWATVKINGILGRDDDPGICIEEYGIWAGCSVKSGGKWFGVDFGGNKELEEKAKQLLGKRILASGKLEERTLDGLIKRQIKVVVVSELEAVSEKESITVQLTGVFHANGAIPYLSGELAITVNGQQYLLDYEGSEGVFAQARKLDGKRVVLTGELRGNLTFQVMRRAEPVTVPVVFLTSVKTADEQGKDSVVATVRGKLERIVDPHMDLLSRNITGWVIHANGREFEVDFGDNKQVLETAAKLNGRIVELTGMLRAEKRFSHYGLCIPPGTKPEYIRSVTVETLRVTELKAINVDSIEETVNVEIQGNLESVTSGGTPELPPRNRWMLTANGKTYDLEFDSNLPKEKPGSLKGKKVIATGTLKDGLVHVTGLGVAFPDGIFR